MLQALPPPQWGRVGERVVLFMNRLVSFAKDLRKNSTNTENALWKYLRAKRLDGFKFRRQEPIGKYIVDFICFESRLIIECDGGQHHSFIYLKVWCSLCHLRIEADRDSMRLKQRKIGRGISGSRDRVIVF